MIWSKAPEHRPKLARGWDSAVVMRDKLLGSAQLARLNLELFCFGFPLAKLWMVPGTFLVSPWILKCGVKEGHLQNIITFCFFVHKINTEILWTQTN